jgi:hypothetical protein
LGGSNVVANSEASILGSSPGNSIPSHIAGSEQQIERSPSGAGFGDSASAREADAEDRRVLNDQNDGNRHDLAGPDLATRGQVDNVNLPHVAKKSRKKRTTDSHPADVVDLAAERNKRQKTQKHEAATRGKRGLTNRAPRMAATEPRIEPVGASMGTVLLRVRWSENGKRINNPPGVARVSREVYQMIREGGNYEAFKQQLIAEYQRAVRASDRTEPRASGAV